MDAPVPVFIAVVLDWSRGVPVAFGKWVALVLVICAQKSLTTYSDVDRPSAKNTKTGTQTSTPHNELNSE